MDQEFYLTSGLIVIVFIAFFLLIITSKLGFLIIQLLITAIMWRIIVQRGAKK